MPMELANAGIERRIYETTPANVEFAFGCHHRERTAVFTIKKRTYQVCLNCGQEFEYSWGLMHAVGLSVADRHDAPLHSMSVNRPPLSHAERPV
jgi:hypothetical protein